MTKSEDDKIDIVIVEDSKTQALLLQEIINKHHYTSKCFQNGNEALNFLLKHPPKIVISDIVMPEIDGYELTKKIKNKTKIPVILLTSLSDPTDILKGLASEADNFLTKPVDENLLISRIKYILINTELRQNRRSDFNFELYFSGHKYTINSDKMQILDLLLSTYEISHKQKMDLEVLNKKLSDTLEKVNLLEGILPICSNCKKIRDKDGRWIQLESYIEKHSEVDFTHGICPECARALYPDVFISHDK